MDNRFSGSASVLHKSTGLSLTLAGGYDDTNNSNRDPGYGYLKIGYSPPLTQIGPTSFSFDVFPGADFSSDGSDSLSFGVAGVQRIVLQDVSFDLYGVVRTYNFDDPTANYQDSLSFMTGARWQF